VGGSKLSDVLDDAKFRIIWPPVKIRVGVGEVPIPIVETLPTTEPPRLMAVLCVADERGGLIKKKESSWIKHEDFPINVGRPKYS